MRWLEQHGQQGLALLSVINCALFDPSLSAAAAGGLCISGDVLCFLGFSTLPGLVAGDRAQRHGQKGPAATVMASHHTMWWLFPG